MPTTALNDKIAAYIASHATAQIAFLQELVRIPSDNPPGNCRPHALATATLLEALGFTVERHDVPDAVARQHGMQAVTNLIVRERFGTGEGPTVALNAHGDVVPPGEGWSTDPYGGEIRAGWLYGRGAAVSKSDFATYAYALAALKACNAPLNGTVELHFTYDEETGGLLGPGWLLAQGLTRPDYAICAAFSHHVITAHNGCLHLEVRLRGRSAHAALPHTGHDAIEAAVPLLQALYRHRDTLAQRHSQTPGIDHPTLVIGLIEAGINTNVVSDTLSLRIDRRIIPEEAPEVVEAELRDIIACALADQPGIAHETERILLARPLAPVAGAERLADLLCRDASAIMGEPVTPLGLPLYTDARLYSEAGIPTVMYGAGPRTLLEANGHRADERLPLTTLGKATRVIAAALCSLLDSPDPAHAAGSARPE